MAGVVRAVLGGEPRAAEAAGGGGVSLGRLYLTRGRVAARGEGEPLRGAQQHPACVLV